MYGRNHFTTNFFIIAHDAGLLAVKPTDVYSMYPAVAVTLRNSLNGCCPTTMTTSGGEHSSISQIRIHTIWTEEKPEHLVANPFRECGNIQR